MTKNDGGFCLLYRIDMKLLQQNGYMTLTDAQENPARVMFCVSRDELYKLLSLIHI